MYIIRWCARICFKKTMMRFKTTRCSESGYQQARPVLDVRPRRFSEQGDSTHLANTSGMPSNFTLGDTEHFDRGAPTSKQRKAGSSRETAKPRHSARQGDLKGSLVVSTDESRDRIKTGQKLLGARRKSINCNGVPESSRVRPLQTTAI